MLCQNCQSALRSSTIDSQCTMTPSRIRHFDIVHELDHESFSSGHFEMTAAKTIYAHNAAEDTKSKPFARKHYS